MAAPMAWKRLVFSVYTPAFSWFFTRVTDRFFRTRERRRGSTVLLLAPLLAEADSGPLASSRPPGFTGVEGLHSRFQWMADHVPAFRVPGGRIRILHSPDEFYQTMKVRIKTAKSRVVMASLYLGTGPLEQDLVDCMEEALERSQEDHVPDLKVSFLLDYTRGSRGKHNSRTMLLPLLQRFPEQMRVSLYHTPDLRGLLRLLVPERFNETIGVQHIKAYLFDNSLIISGANLSDSYFTNRQDRYVLLEDCEEVADFFAELVGAVGDVSLQLHPDNSVHMMEGMVHPYKGNRAEFSASAQRRIMEVVNTARVRQSMLECSDILDSDRTVPNDTWIIPLVQMKPLGIHLDEQVTQRLLIEAGGDSVVYLTSGYFNLTRTYMQLVLGAAADYRILMASPEVNGFFGAKGVAGAIPEAYVHLARQFYNKVCQLGQQSRVHLHEYHRPNWTFHAKGLWYYVGGRDRPCLTLIGSPNFGYRSVHRDLEAQIAIATENEELQMQLQQVGLPLSRRQNFIVCWCRHIKAWLECPNTFEGPL
uniref:CDP-diacylglycerol--glycerol-3-phosphate 3-phosphatidyltransferase n=1 Tax=Sinocyclocheilus grahami TaxID=75366 RepID=A0A672M8U5_SINGR